MADQIKDGGPAFPSKPLTFPYPSPGMSLRDWFAGQQLRVIGSGWPNAENMGRIADDCYAMADAMLAARESK